MELLSFIFAALLGAAVVIVSFSMRAKKTPPVQSGGACILAIGTAKPRVENEPILLPKGSINNLYGSVLKHVGVDALSFATKVEEKGRIDSRATCVPELLDTSLKEGKFATSQHNPSHKIRAEMWQQFASGMAVEAAAAAIKKAKGVSASDITHVVSHSCTGWKAPGLAFDVIQGLGMKSTTRRIEVNFMGCFGAFTGMYVAKNIVENDPNAKVIVLCAELCTLHVTSSPQRELLIGNTLFADGAAAAVIGQGGEWALTKMGSHIVPNSAEMMTWEPGSHEYKMWLSRGIPKALGEFFGSNAKTLLKDLGIGSFTECEWAIHPGGASILYAIGKCLNYYGIKDSEEALKDSYDILKNNGNMSSPTVLYVLEKTMKRTTKDAIFTASFGPGLTLEYGALHRVKADTSAR